MDEGICSLGTLTPDNAFQLYVCDPDSNKLVGMCRAKSTDVLGKSCVSHLKDGSNDGQDVMHPVLGIRNAGSNSLSGGPTAVFNSTGGVLSHPNRDDVTEFSPDNSDFAEGTGGMCGEFLFYNATAVSTAMGTDNVATPESPALSLAGTPRAALWTGFCDSDRVCRECVPGAGSNGHGASFGQICLNGQLLSAKDVDGTDRSYTTDTVASTQLGTTFMVILLVILFAVHMYTVAREFRHGHSLQPMTCCEVFLCCGACSRLGSTAEAAGKRSKSEVQMRENPSFAAKTA
jgi:hypothetical protein